MLGVRLIFDFRILAFDLYQTGIELRRLAAFELGDNRPVFFGRERLNVTFAVDDHAQGDGLHAAAGNSTPHFVPEQRADLITDQAVQYSSGLLRVHARRTPVHAERGYLEVRIRVFRHALPQI